MYPAPYGVLQDAQSLIRGSCTGSTPKATEFTWCHAHQRSPGCRKGGLTIKQYILNAPDGRIHVKMGQVCSRAPVPPFGVTIAAEAPRKPKSLCQFSRERLCYTPALPAAKTRAACGTPFAGHGSPPMERRGRSAIMCALPASTTLVRTPSMTRSTTSVPATMTLSR